MFLALCHWKIYGGLHGKSTLRNVSIFGLMISVAKKLFVIAAVQAILEFGYIMYLQHLGQEYFYVGIPLCNSYFCNFQNWRQSKQFAALVDPLFDTLTPENQSTVLKLHQLLQSDTATLHLGPTSFHGERSGANLIRTSLIQHKTYLGVNNLSVNEYFQPKICIS